MKGETMLARGAAFALVSGAASLAWQHVAARFRLGGLRFAETMSGRWRRTSSAGDSSAERLFRFSVIAESADLLSFAADGVLRLAGTLEAGGLSTARSCHGTLAIRPFSSPPTLTYDLAFDGDDGLPYRFSGTKTLDLLHLPTTISTLPGRVVDSRGLEVGICLLHFDLRNDLVSFLGSFALAHARP